MPYVVKIDDNGKSVNEGLHTITPLFIQTDATGVVALDIPLTVFGFLVKRCPVLCDISVNGSAFFPLDEGDMFSPFVDELTITLNKKEVGTEPIIVLLLS